MNPLNLFKRESRTRPPPVADICPNCHHEDRRYKNVARKVGGTVGTLAGAASGVSGILSAARIGMQIGAPAGPAGAVLTAIAAATLRGIIGATIGCEVGTALGGLIDRHVLECDSCRNCGFPFGASMRSPTMPSRPPFGYGPQSPAGDIDIDNDEDDEPGLGSDAPRYPVLI